MRLERRGRPQATERDDCGRSGPEASGRFFSEVFKLERGRYTARVQLLFSESAHGEKITVAIGSEGGKETLTVKTLVADPSRPEAADQNFLDFELTKPDFVEISGHASANYDTHLVRFITILDRATEGLSRESFFFPRRQGSRLDAVRTVNFGTTGVCNATCFHCPVNKPSRRLQHGLMDLGLFRRIITELHECGFSGNITFGLFAEPLEDRLIFDRLEYIRDVLPGVRISIATNCALFDPAVHLKIVDLVDGISVHVELPIPEVYDQMMQPLKAVKVFPRIRALLNAAAERNAHHKVQLATPLHARNISSIDRFEEVFSRKIRVGAVSNRCWKSSPFRELALAPTAVICRPEKLQQELFIDWDGAVLPCCQDFSKSMPVGNVNQQRLSEIFESEAWLELFETFRRGEWFRKPGCSQCRRDYPPEVEKIARTIMDLRRLDAVRYAPSAFRAAIGSSRSSDGSIVISSKCPDGHVIWGPFQTVPSGRYTISHDIDFTADRSTKMRLWVDIASNGGRVVASRELKIDDQSCDSRIEFCSNGQEIFEFRLHKRGNVNLIHRGAILCRDPGGELLARPTGIRTRVSAVKGRRPGPLDDGRSYAMAVRAAPEGAVAIRAPVRRRRGIASASCEPFWAKAVLDELHQAPPVGGSCRKACAGPRLGAIPRPGEIEEKPYARYSHS